MKFAEAFWLFGAAFALVVAGLLVAGGVLLLRAVRRFGDEARILDLVTARAANRRAVKGALLVLSVALGFVALARPQYGRGTRLVPATNLDVVVVLDYSKSMYARDVSPSRIERAKVEVTRLVAELPGARFGAVAFAGQPMSFPLTSDGSAISQFFRQLSPNDMPVGGTAIARALEAARELFKRDPLSKQHKKVMILVTDGEDLEGDPVAVAQAARAEEIAIHVVQIGGRTPEPLPEVNEAGDVTGWRTSEDGRPITTSLSAEGEAQLARVAETAAGRVVRSQGGETGILEIARRLGRMMSEELSERVETVYADVYMYPLGAAILLLVLETFVGESTRRKLPSRVPPAQRRKKPRRRRELERATASGLLVLLAGAPLAGAPLVAGCTACDQAFSRRAPPVNEAIELLDAGDAGAATELLERYLMTGKCEQGNIGTPDLVRERPNATFDLGLGLFELGEQFGDRFGEEERNVEGGAAQQAEAQLAQRSEQVECALRIVQLIAADASLPIELRARAHYLAGNLEFLRRDYRSAVKAYELALQLIPGMPGDAGDSIGRDAAWNRAVALRRIEEQEQDASPESGPPDAQPEGGDGNDGGSPDAGQDGAGGPPDAGKQDDTPDAGPDGGSSPPRDQDRPDAAPPKQQPQPEPQSSPSVNQDERMLDMLERAPTLQQHDAKNRALKRGVSGMEDK